MIKRREIHFFCVVVLINDDGLFVIYWARKGVNDAIKNINCMEINTINE